ncbi:SDR family oxidoreductase [Pseudonocardiaceae bacterium YIM PH 21723]|nr:SDR family oxidoreductase [Pseudonocardiaceae bacterium YIM PH 21723]
MIDRTAVVTGAGRGFGRAIALALSAAGVDVVGVARDRLDERFTSVVADAADPGTAGRLLDAHRPGILVLNAGAVPAMLPIQHQTWQTFSRNWEVDVQQVFHWIREALLRPLAPGSVVIAMSSGAALAGSPLSGGYAGAKATIRLITGYAADESRRAGLGIRFVSVLPKLTPATELGAAGVAAYAERQGVDAAGFLAGFGPTLTPEDVGAAILDLATDPGRDRDAYLLLPGGLRPID